MFEKFPRIKYSLTHDNKTLTDYILTDLTVRAKINTTKEALLRYKISPYETPDDVSQKMYGTPYYHWVILMLNDIFDPLEEWYMSDDQLRGYCEQKYNVVHTIPAADVSEVNDVFLATAHGFKPNDVVTLSSLDLPGGLYENTEYFIFNTTTDTFQLTANIHDEAAIDITSVGTEPIVVTCNKTDQIAYWFDEQNNVMSTALDLYEGWSNNETTRVTFQNTITDIISTTPAKNSYIPATNKNVVDVGGDIIDITDTVTPPDQLIQRNLKAITNFDYESIMNERHRLVYVLKPEYMKTFIDQFNAVVQP